MKDEPRNRSLWERIKMAFRLLFSMKALEPVYKEGWEDGRRGIYDDYKVMKETIEPFVRKIHDEAWKRDSGITIPGMNTQELYRVPFMEGEDVLGPSIIGSPYPPERMALAYETYRQDTIQKAFKSDRLLAQNIELGYREASKCLAGFLLKEGFIKHQVIADPTCPYPTFVFFTNVMKRL